VAFLRDHALAGRLTHEELEERVGAAYAAVTIGDLERLIDDLPRARHPAPPRPRPVQARRKRNDGNPALVVAGVALLLITGLPVLFAAGAFILLVVVFAVSFALGPFLLVALLIALGSRRRRPPRPPMRYGRVY
jgi:hypothetical protein